MTDQLTDNFETVDALGNVGANFAGRLHVAGGIDLDEIATLDPGDSINWRRLSDNAVTTYLQETLAGGVLRELDIRVLEPGTSTFAELRISETVGGGARLRAAVAGPGTGGLPLLRQIIDDLGQSDFVQNDATRAVRYLGRSAVFYAGAPQDLDVFDFVADAAKGVVWRFVYNAGSASASKWEYVGGPPLSAQVLNDDTTLSAVYVDLATVGPSVTLPRSGDYEIVCSCWAYGSVAAALRCSPKLGAAGASDNDAIRMDATAANIVGTGDATIIRTGLAAAAAVKLQYATSAGTGHFGNRQLAVRPIRVT